MAEEEKKLQPFGAADVSGDSEAIHSLKRAIAQGKHWYIALLEAIELWTKAEEVYKGRKYRYLIANEAFDWLLLAERLLEEVSSLIPEKEMIDLLFFGKAPIELGKEEFQRLIGNAKYWAHLNYFYGVAVEEALILAVEEEVLKEQRARAFNESDRPLEETYQRIYGAPMMKLVRGFRKEQGYPQRNSMELAELKEFTYWLFKYRLNNCDKARVASDTKKALRELQRQWSLKGRRMGSA
ncbi:MAG: hypothetical protein ACE5IE_00875 [Dehalococcoidia bacterium]